MANWRNRIVGYGTVPVGELLGNGENFRVHPSTQQKAMESILSEIGWVAPCLVSKRTQRLLDGEMRSKLAMRKNDNEPVPVVLLDLTEEEEKLVLATFDPIGALAVADNASLASLLSSVDAPSPEIAEFLDGLKPAFVDGNAVTPKPKKGKSVTCPDCGAKFQA